MEKRINIRVSDGLYARLVGWAEEAGFTPGQVLRGMALLLEVVIEDPAILSAMARDPLVRRSQLVRVLRQVMESEPLLPMDGLEGEALP